jgi:hypothetical protein
MDETSAIPSLQEHSAEKNGKLQDSTKELTFEELRRELEAYGQNYPVPDWKDGLPDFRWFQAHRYDPEIQAHRGDYVAIFDGKVIGADENSLKLELECAKRLQVHPARIRVEWVDDGRDLHVTLHDYYPESSIRESNAQDSPPIHPSQASDVE